MHPDTALSWFILGVLTKRRYDALIAKFSDLETALSHLHAALLQSLGCREETVARMLQLHASINSVEYRRRMEREQVALITIEDGQYPSLLRDIPDAPVFLSYRGNLSLLSRPCLGVVGTRAMSRYGKRVTEIFIPPIVHSGVVTVSGLALGIDGAVAHQTMAAGGATVAVLGHGLGSIYPPSHTDLAEEIVASGGLLLSEFPLDIVPDKYTFPSRNRIIAGLSRGVLVVEAGEESGALITVELALEYGREAFAVPGSIFDEHARGCHRVIARGEAKLVTSAEDVLSEIGVLPRAQTASKFSPRDAGEAAVYALLSGMPCTVSDLAERSRIGPGSIGATLTTLELSGAARNLGDGTWVRI